MPRSKRAPTLWSGTVRITRCRSGSIAASRSSTGSAASRSLPGMAGAGTVVGPGVLALREMPDPPPPGAGEVQVRIAARGVQYVDVLMLAGKYQFRPEPPFIPGNEAAGVVVAVGDGATQFKAGDQVMSRHRL